jgi:hypothetical protein
MANLTGNQKLAILAVVVIVILYLIYMQREGAENVQTTKTVASVSDSYSTDTQSVDTKSVETQSVDTEAVSEVDKELIKKMTGPNAAKDGKEKVMNYRDGERGDFSQNLDQFFEEGNPLNANENADFLPNDPDNNFAAYAGKPRRELSEEEKFNAVELLPKEEKQDWFEDVTPQKIKNRHLINIYRPIGVNTVITSRKNGSLDIRGNPVNPKTFVSPFLNSSIDPDVNARGICS